MLECIVGLCESNRLLLHCNSANLRNPLSLSSKMLFDRQIAAGLLVSSGDSRNKGACSMVGLEKTPHYVLKAGTLTHESSVVPSESGSATYAIFGFSDKPQYDRFMVNATEGLTPYPLVKIFLQDQLAQEGNTLRLVILDPVSFDALEWKAATFESVLESIQSRSEFVKASHRLVRQESSSFYRALPSEL
jgi:hypothetical protein